MKSKDILKKIIVNQGSCGWIDLREPACKYCPFSHLKKHASGHWMSCVEATNTNDVPMSEANSKYMALATMMLLDQEIEDMLASDIDEST